LANLLGHSFILRPQYDFAVTGGATDMWQSPHGLAGALKDPVLIKASCPLEMSGVPLYGLLFMCPLLS